MIRSASPRLRLLPSTSSHPPRGSLTPSCPSFPVHKRETINDLRPRAAAEAASAGTPADVCSSTQPCICLHSVPPCYTQPLPIRPLLASWCIANQSLINKGTVTVAETTKRRRSAHDVIATKPSCLFACLFVHSWSVPHSCCVSVKVAVSGSSSSHRLASMISVLDHSRVPRRFTPLLNESDWEPAPC